MFDASQSATVLIVDDEPNVINSLKRALREQPFKLLGATSGKSALLLLEEEGADLVICDVRMPEMDGPTLLREIESRWPDCMRILLTGYEDIEQTIRAINEGRIFRYISKPWDDRLLLLAIKQALAHQHIERDRNRLQLLTQEQNVALQQANSELESRVQARTAELMRAADMLSAANENLKQAYVTATEVFSALLSQRLPRSRQTNKEVIELMRAFCRSQEYSQQFTDDLSMAAALYNLGKLTWNDALIALPPESMERVQRENYKQYPTTGERLLIALEPAHDAALIIRHHQERWDGAGFPDGLVGTAIPLGARILKLVVDFVEMQMGMVFARKVPLEEMIEKMPKYAGRLYDPELCAAFIELVKRLEEEKEALSDDVITHNTSTLRPNMVIARSLHAQNGMLLLKEGTVITERLINKLKDFEDNEETQYVVHVLQEEFDEDA
ncbi:MAG: two-component system response regulator [Pusillimonas sp.]|nr:two-component system response regulator [Pusillimonas sp.]